MPFPFVRSEIAEGRNGVGFRFNTQDRVSAGRNPEKLASERAATGAEPLEFACEVFVTDERDSTGVGLNLQNASG